MPFKFYLFLLTCALVVAVASADIFGDLFKWDLMSVLTGEDDDEETDGKGKREDEDGSPQSNCDCEGPKCNCCVDFNISSVIDLGGPGCVTLKYLSQTEGVALNVSYGDSILHSQTVTDTNKKGTCMPLLSDLAQICARFNGLTATEDGLTGCLNFEPTVFGEITSQYHVGCFRMGPDGMFVDGTVNATAAASEGEEEDEEEEESPGDEKTPAKPEEATQSFMEVVNQSAEEGLAFFTNLLGINLGSKKTTNSTTEKQTEEIATEVPQKRKGKFLGASRNLL